MADLSLVISKWQSLSRDAVVEKVVEEKNIEELTSLKLKLCDKGRKVKDFARGEFYCRKSEGSSNFSSPEEILVDDV